MAKKSKTDKSSSDEEKAPSGPTRIELVTPLNTTQVQAGRLGLGLLLSVPLGWPPLTDAFSGRGPYEISLAKFLLVVGACVVATSILGSLLDKAPAALAGGNDSGTVPATASAASGRDFTDGSATPNAGKETSEHQFAPIRS